MRIAYVTAHYPPDFVSGATLQVQRLAATAAQLGNDVEVFSGAINAGLDDGVVRTELVDGVTTHWIGTADRTEQGDDGNWINPGAATAAAQFLADFEPDVVHIHTLQTLGVGVVEAALDSGAPVIVTMHDMWWWCSRLFLVDTQLQPCPLITDVNTCACARNPSWRAERARRLTRALSRVDRILTPSESLRALVIANGVDPSRVAVDENDIGEPGPLPPETSSVRQSGRHENLEPRQNTAMLRILYVGGDSPLKGGDVVREVSACLGDTPGWALDAYGMTPDLSLHRQLRTHPSFDPGDLGEVLAAADVLLIPSIARESYSLVAREALVAGLPIITSDCLGPEEVVAHMVNGLIVPTGDVDATVDAITKLIDNPGLLDAFRNHAKQHVIATRSTQAHVTSLLSVYDGVIDAKLQDGSTSSRSLPESVAFVVGVDGDSARSRVHHPAAALELHGVLCTTTHHLDPALDRKVAGSDVVVLYRVPPTVELFATIAHLRESGSLVLFDTGDWRPSREDLTPTRLGAERRTQAACAGTLVPTNEHALLIAPEFDGPIEVSPDALGPVELRLAQRATDPSPSPHTKTVLNGLPAPLSRLVRGVRRATSPVWSWWGSRLGSPLWSKSHALLNARRTRDPRVLAITVAPPAPADQGATADQVQFARRLERALRSRPDLDIDCVGFAPAFASFPEFVGRCRTVPNPSWRSLPGLLSTADVNLVQASPGPDAWLVAASVGVPTAVLDDDLGVSFVDGSPDERRAGHRQIITLDELLDNRALRQRVGAAARRAAELHHGPHTTANDFLRALERIKRSIGERVDGTSQPLVSQAATGAVSTATSPMDTAHALESYDDNIAPIGHVRRWFLR
jgi:glycosyltransferase involved in cell wall biosynthesis